MRRLAIGRQATSSNNHRMASNWISRLAQGLADLYDATRVAAEHNDWDADARRMRAELDAIRARFPDHA